MHAGYKGGENMRKEQYTVNGHTYVRITKKQAEKHFLQGDEIHVAMNNSRMNYLGCWNVNGLSFDNRHGNTPERFQHFCDLLLSQFKYYRLGTYLKYFIEI